MRKLKYPIPRMTPIKKLIQLALDGADGRIWYHVAESQIREYASDLNISTERFAAFLALFSPRVSVLRSCKWAIHYARTREFMADCPISIRLAVDHYVATGQIRGAKTNPFARTLIGCPAEPVLDSWMGLALNADSKRFEVKAVWNRAAKKIRIVAETLGWPVSETQAAIWTAIVRKSGRTVPAFNLGVLITPEIPV